MRAADFVESYFDAWNHHNPEGVAGHLAHNGVYCDIPEQAERSYDELVSSLESFFAEFHHHYELVGDVLASRNTLAFQYRMIPADDASECVYHGAEFITLDKNAALLIRDYYDVPGKILPSTLALSEGRRSRCHKYAKSGLSEENLLFYKQRLEELMRSQQVYLRADLTLPGLARLLDCSVNHLSQVINSGFGMSFFDYLNRQRIEHAKALLTELDDEGHAITNIAYSVGFKSNSSFYAAFKKHVGLTPARYRMTGQDGWNGHRGMPD